MSPGETDTRFKGVEWEIPTLRNNCVSWEGVQTAVLMDIRDELRALNNLLHCPNFLAMPRLLGEIRRNTAKPKKRRVIK